MNGYECLVNNRATIQSCVRTMGPDFRFDIANITNFETNDISPQEFKVSVYTSITKVNSDRLEYSLIVSSSDIMFTYV